MPGISTVNAFIKKVETERHDLVLAEYYTEDASIQENQDPPRMGRDTLIEYERQMLGKAEHVSSQCLRPFFVDGNEVMIRWKFQFLLKDGSHIIINEVVHQVWEGDKIRKEQFFYDPRQFVPVKAS